MKRAWILGLAFSACACTRTPAEGRPGASADPPAPAASAAPPPSTLVTASASAPVAPAPRLRSPPDGAASRADREKAALDLLEGRGHAAELPLADVAPGEAFEPLLRAAMNMPMSIRIGAVTTTDLDEAETRKVVEREMMRFRTCYVAGLRLNPNLIGLVTGRVVVGAPGEPHTVVDGGTDLPDREVVACVLAALGKIGLPSPRGARGTAVVPLLFSPG